MIFITVGTQPQPFNRLFNEVQKMVDDGLINEEVIAQIGSSDLDSNKIKIYKYLSLSDTIDNINRARIIISHGGTGSIITSLKMGKKVIGVPRLSKFGEHVNDHQVDLIDELSKQELILPVYDIHDLYKIIQDCESFIPKRFISGQEQLINDIKNYILND